MMNNDNKSFLKSMSVLTSGSAISMCFLAIHHLAIPYIFFPEELGIRSVLLAIPTACIAIICGRYDLTLVYEDDENNIDPLLKLNFYICFYSSTIITLINLLYFVLFNDTYLQYWYVLPAIWLYLLSYGLTLIFNSYNNRYRDYKTISKMYVIRSAAQNLLPVILGVIIVSLFNKHSLAIAVLVIPYCVGMGVGLYSQGQSVFKRIKSILGINNHIVLKVAKKHLKQPLLSAPAMLANGLSYSLITIMTNYLFGEAVTGYYSLSITLLGLPITLISGNLSKVFTKDASVEYESTRGYQKTFKKNCSFLIVIALPVLLIMYFLAPSICGWLFGENWILAGTYMKALSIMFTFRFVSTALSPGLYICNKQNIELLIQVLFVFVTAFTGIYSYYCHLESISFMWMIGLTRSIVMLAHVILVYYYSIPKKGVSFSNE